MWRSTIMVDTWASSLRDSSSRSNTIPIGINGSSPIEKDASYVATPLPRSPPSTYTSSTSAKSGNGRKHFWSRGQTGCRYLRPNLMSRDRAARTTPGRPAYTRILDEYSLLLLCESDMHCIVPLSGCPHETGPPPFLATLVCARSEPFRHLPTLR